MLAMIANAGPWVNDIPGIWFKSQPAGTMEMLKKEAGIDMQHVPYKGSPPMITDLIGGRIDVAFEPIGSVLTFEKSARVKFLGSATLKRYAAAPTVPTLSEQGLPGFEAVPGTAVLVPKGTPPLRHPATQSSHQPSPQKAGIGRSVCSNRKLSGGRRSK
jgi:hypothetical protein